MRSEYPAIPPVSMHFEQVRRDRNMSGADMARIAGVEPMTYYRWRNGESIPPWSAVRRIGAFFGISLGDFYDVPEGGLHFEKYEEVPGNTTKFPLRHRGAP